MLNSRLHDFGFRGCTSVEQSVIGGTAHLLNFNGSDTMSACYHATHHLNKGIPVGISIPATEHSVMTSWPDEIQAIKNLCNNFPGKLVACVMDSYNYDNALNFILPQVAETIEKTKCHFVIRPDSGDAVQQVMKGLRAGEEWFGCVQNERGYKVINNVSVIQGDGIDYKVIARILEAVLAEGFSAENVAFGMGGGLLQKLNRDTMAFATKLCYTKTLNIDGKPPTELNSMKSPDDDKGKWSLPGKLMVLQEKIKSTDTLGPHKVYDEETGNKLIKAGTHKNSMIVVYDGTGEATPEDKAQIDQFHDETFDQVKARLDMEWNQNKNTLTYDVVDAVLRTKQTVTKEKRSEEIRVMQVNMQATMDTVKAERKAAIEAKTAAHNANQEALANHPALKSNFTASALSILHVLNKAL
jgi:nicotinic acid phosphoribosyltransferase